MILKNNNKNQMGKLMNSIKKNKTKPIYWIIIKDFNISKIEKQKYFLRKMKILN